MLTFTHTYLLLLAYRKVEPSFTDFPDAELILGNVIPDFVTHLGRDKFQAMAHDLSLFTSIGKKRKLEWGTIFHILCDNYTTLKRITFEGDYHQYPRDGFIERLAHHVNVGSLKKIPKRRILQCAFDVIILRHERDILVKMLSEAETYLQHHFDEVLSRISRTYQMQKDDMKAGIERFSLVYGPHFIQKSSQPKYRLFPLIRSKLNLDTMTDPGIIHKHIDEHSELMDMVEQHIELIRDSWHDLLEETAHEVLKFSGMAENLV